MSQSQWNEQTQLARDHFESILTRINRARDCCERVDRVERGLFYSLLALGRMLLDMYLQAPGDGDQGKTCVRVGKKLVRSAEPISRDYRSIFGKQQPIVRYTYSAGAKKAQVYCPTDAQLGLPKYSLSYVLESWLGRRVVQIPFQHAIEDFRSLFGHAPSVETAETMHRHSAEHARRFRFECLEEAEAMRTTELEPTGLNPGLDSGFDSWTWGSWPGGTLESTAEQLPAAEPPSADAQAGTTENPPDDSDVAVESADVATAVMPPSEQAVLVISADGGSFPVHSADRSQTPDSRAGSKAGTTRRAYCGAAYTTELFPRTADEILDESLRGQALANRPRPQDKRVWAELSGGGAGCPKVFLQLILEAKRRDPAGKLPIVALMDGEKHLWESCSEWFTPEVEILDFYHAMERVRKVAKIYYPGNDSDSQAERKAWVSSQLSDLLSGNLDAVLRRWSRAVRTRKAWRKSDRTVVEKALTYFRNNCSRMHYSEYLSAGYPIGSGVIEGTVRNLIKDRMDGTGMRWRLAGAEAMLQTRALYLNSEWEQYMAHRAEAEQVALYPADYYYQNAA